MLDFSFDQQLLTRDELQVVSPDLRGSALIWHLGLNQLQEFNEVPKKCVVAFQPLVPEFLVGLSAYGTHLGGKLRSLCLKVLITVDVL